MKVLILSSLHEKTGNNSTARRIRKELLETDIKCELKGINEFDGRESLHGYITEHGIDCILGVHACRAGSLLLECKIPYCIIFGGTDINEYHQNVLHLETMTRAVSNARYLVAFSNEMKNQALKIWPSCEDKIIIQPQAISIEETENEHNQVFRCQQILLDSLQLDVKSLQNAVLFLLIAGLRRVKDPLFLTKAVSEWHRQNERIHLVIVGPELDKEFSLEVKTQIQNLPGVALLPPVDSKDLQTIMKLSFAVVNSSISEGMATSLIEAMALGVPVIARNIPANAAIINHQLTGFLFNNPDEFVSTAKKLMQSTASLYNVVRNALEYVGKNHSYEEEKATYTSIIEKMTLK